MHYTPIKTIDLAPYCLTFGNQDMGAGVHFYLFNGHRYCNLLPGMAFWLIARLGNAIKLSVELNFSIKL